LWEWRTKRKEEKHGEGRKVGRGRQKNGDYASK